MSAADHASTVLRGVQAAVGDAESRWLDLRTSALEAANAGRWDTFTDTQRLMGRELIAEGHDGEALAQMLWVCFLEMNTPLDPDQPQDLLPQSEALWQVDRLSRRLGVGMDRLQLLFVAECEGRRPALLPLTADDAWPTLRASLQALVPDGREQGEASPL